MDGLKKGIQSGHGWVANSGGLSFNLPKTVPTCCVPLLQLQLWQKGERCVTGLEECKVIRAKYHSLVPPLYISCFCLSGCCFEAFPWEQWSRAGRCCCPWCRNSQTWWSCNTRRVFVIWASAAYKHCQAVIIKTCVAHIQHDKFSSTPTHVNIYWHWGGQSVLLPTLEAMSEWFHNYVKCKMCLLCYIS